ncbi:DUF962 domain-containing protein [Solirubrum puertoriconensis]|uniref:DUF962 domain-containing protein n=1 Tax=Solirubrum puertoriconensis TaxID=1751427 RepID=A0A9X0HLK7_SOLP1|nr:DUF962 domain-containing protein [Solirubrum puertoriconensis]KUG08185.1 hypothetical protein ASU33_08310 [Solirubrum puertoriconensis]
MAELPAQPTFAEFYPYYLREHQQHGTRVLHFIGTSLFLLMMVAAVVLLRPWLLLVGVVLAYGFAWVGHFFVEHNRPATFRYPLLSLRGDFQLYWDLLRGKEKF